MWLQPLTLLSVRMGNAPWGDDNYQCHCFLLGPVTLHFLRHTNSSLLCGWGNKMVLSYFFSRRFLFTELIKYSEIFYEQNSSLEVSPEAQRKRGSHMLCPVIPEPSFQFYFLPYLTDDVLSCFAYAFGLMNPSLFFSSEINLFLSCSVTVSH